MPVEQCVADDETRLREQLVSLILRNAPLMLALRAASQLGLESWAIGAGAIRSLVWDHLHGFTLPTPVSDWDFIYYDATSSQLCDELSVKQYLQKSCPEFQWDVVNQATVHWWLSKQNGLAMPPFTSLEDGIASWPETATCVAVSLDHAGNVTIISPLGLADLFDMHVRFNLRCASVDAYRQRIVSKRFDQIWPRLKITQA
ncbi:nucleotidyltransferase family protein [Undibacterium sp. LX40W]|uniref:Nucleotidyltransferase family protein n=1 Tax=Undibacterium nitidum TaxID=2762298 RepID=A0A923HMK9_9BURK|nr:MULTISPECIES: nucleotidyltransferase family protein [Undibacterium]MBC3882169.1 nucleotidyltransferase family protein [Undibacterium nitidum]MBC3892450.1 nucleotidyltransferase family protein [Undibacterium sp. LX40W]